MAGDGGTNYGSVRSGQPLGQSLGSGLAKPPSLVAGGLVAGGTGGSTIGVVTTGVTGGVDGGITGTGSVVSGSEELAQLCPKQRVNVARITKTLIINNLLSGGTIAIINKVN